MLAPSLLELSSSSPLQPLPLPPLFRRILDLMSAAGVYLSSSSIVFHFKLIGV